MNAKRTAVACTLFAACGAATAAGTQASYVIGPNIEVGSAMNSLVPITRSIALNTPDNTGTADLTNLATFGVIKSSAAVTTTGPGKLQIQNSSQTTDELTFGSAGLSGQAGIVTARLYYNWSQASAAAGSQGSASTEASLLMNLGTGGVSAFQTRNVACSFSGICAANGVPLLVAGTVVNAVPFAYIDGRFPIVFGQETVLFTSFTEIIGGQSTAGGQSAATVDAAHSIYWGGILGVTDSSGAAVPYHLTTASGTDYAHSFAPVPEPGAALLMAIGTAALLLLPRRSRRAHRSADQKAA